MRAFGHRYLRPYLLPELLMNSSFDLLAGPVLHRASVAARAVASLYLGIVFGVQFLLVLHHLLISINTGLA